MVRDNGKIGLWSYRARTIPALLLIAILFLIPMAFVFSSAIREGTLAEALCEGATYRILLFTAEEAFLSALVSTLLAIPFAAFFASYRFPGRRAILALSGLSFTMPAILVVLGFVIWYGNNGYLNTMLSQIIGQGYRPFRILYTFPAIILAHAYLNFPIAFLIITGAWSERSGNEEYAAYSLGRSRIWTFLHVTLPSLRGSAAASFALIFLYCFSSFAIVLVLGGQPRYYTMEAEIYRRVYIDADIPSAAAISIIALAATALLLLITPEGRREKKVDRKRRTLRKAHGWSLAAAFIIMFLILSFLLPPMLAIVYRSFHAKGGAFTVDHWIKGLESGSMAIAASFAIALISAWLSVSAASAIALYSSHRRSRILSFISTLPLAAGSVTIGLGLLIVSSAISRFLPLSADWIRYIMLLAAHVMITLPFSIRTLIPRAKAIPEILRESAYTLGMSPGRTIRKVEKPLLRGGRRKAFCFAFALSLGEVNATMMISLGRLTTLPALIYDLIGRYDYQSASALGTVLLLEALIVFILAEIGDKNGIS